MCASTNGAVKAAGSLCSAGDLLVCDTLTGTDRVTDATKVSVAHAARGETALCVLLCNKRRVRRLSEQWQGRRASLVFLPSTGAPACARVLCSSQTTNSKKWSRGAGRDTCVQRGSRTLLLKCHARALLVSGLLQFSVQFS